MLIPVVTGVGTASTELAAFDDGLVRAGVHNFNLIRLSSVIPPGTTVEVQEGPVRPAGTWGDRLYVVMAEYRATRLNDEAWAGIGWVQTDDGRGLFVEHEGASEETVRRDIVDSLAALVKVRPEHTFGPVSMAVCGGRVEHDPICAVAVAVFESAQWQSA